MSPTQREGPMALSVADIQAHMNGIKGNEAPRPSIDEVLPALSMMRMQNGSQADLLFEPRSQAQPQAEDATIAIPPAAVPKSPILEAMPMQAIPSGLMSPDEMLKSYAERRHTGTSTPTSGSIGTNMISYPMPVASPVSATNNMRTLYTPTTPSAVSTPGTNNPFRKSMAGGEEHPPRRSTETQYENEDAYFGSN